MSRKLLFQEKEFDIYYFFALLGLGFFILFFVFFHFGVSPTDFLKFITGFLLLVYIPGQTLLKISKLKAGRIETFSLSLVLGLVTTTVINKFSRWFQAEFLFYLWIIFCLVFFVFWLIKNPPRKKDFAFRITPIGISASLIVLLVFSALVVDNYRNGVRQENGSVIFNMHYYDGFYRNAVSRELSHTVPPQVPAVADLSLSYHYGMDLFVSLFYRYLGLNIFDLNHRFVLTFFFVLLILMLFVLIKELTSSDQAALLGIFLVVFGSGGLAYLSTWFLGISQWGNIFYSFYFFNITNVNSFLPVISILLGGFFCLFKYLKTHCFPWLVFSGVLFALSLEFKTFVIGPVVGALFLSGLILFIKSRDSSILKAWLLTTILALPLLYAAYSHNTGGLPYVFKVGYVDWIILSLSNLKLTYLFLIWKEIILHAQITFINIVMLIPCILIFFLGSFGLGLAALPSVIKEFFSFRKIRPERHFLACFFGGNLLYFFFIQLFLGGRPRNYVHIYAFFLCFIVLTIFWAEKIIKFISRRKKIVGMAILLCVAAISIPNTAQFLWVKVRFPQTRLFSPTFLQTAEWLNKNTSPESVLLHPLNLRYVCYFTDRRVVLDNSSHSYLTFHLTPRQIKKRSGDIQSFYKDPTFNAKFFVSYNVSYVLFGKPLDLPENNKNMSSRIICYSNLGAKETLKYQKSHFLALVYENEDFMIFKVGELPDKEKGVFLLEIEGGKKILQPFKEYKRKRLKSRIK